MTTIWKLNLGITLIFLVEQFLQLFKYFTTFYPYNFIIGNWKIRMLKMKTRNVIPKQQQ